MLKVACAIIRNDDDLVLVVQRDKDTDHPLEWEFPGGKIRRGESEGDAVIREIDEELSMDIVIVESLEPVEYNYGFKKIKLFPLVCDTLTDKPLLHEHSDFRWVKAPELEAVDLCGADKHVASDYVNNYVSGEDIPENNYGLEELSDKEKQKVKDTLSRKGGVGACEVLADACITNPKLLKLLVDFSFSNDTTLAFRASYSITKAEEKIPGLSEEYYPLFVQKLGVLNNESVIRAFLKILAAYDFTRFEEKHHGIIAERCFYWLRDNNTAIAIRVYSMENLLKLSLIYPDLRNELYSTVLQVMENASAGIKSRGKQILKQL
ncbi:MAG TPA: (deoxy)nucleoside triphosphate pyrophosphohydrolase [Bacteroidales bacterium]|nr:(deoxy)nucleoside triphosphate pyrophosphohydrolase [Bacteroidales bacterium]